MFGNEGLEYLEIGRLWQVGLLLGFVLWTFIVARGFKPLLDQESRCGLAHLILYAGASIGVLFTASMLYTPTTSMVMTEFWRWWVVHMWVEGVFEFFIVAVIGVTYLAKSEHRMGFLDLVHDYRPKLVVRPIPLHVLWILRCREKRLPTLDRIRLSLERGIEGFFIPLRTGLREIDHVPITERTVQMSQFKLKGTLRRIIPRTKIT